MHRGKAEITISHIVDIESVTRYYLLQLSTISVPAKPVNNPPGGKWATTEPSYSSGSTDTLYFVDCTVFTNKSFKYSAVSKSSSYEAAKQAYNKAVNAQNTANNANNYVNNAKNNYGYQYKYTLTINGPSTSLYYPVVLRGGNQNIMREIMVVRSYSDKAPTDWNGHPSLHGISLLLKIKCNYGGWGGANYSWNIHDLEECYGNVFGGATRCMDNMGFAIFLRGGGTTGALYHIYSDQPIEATQMNGKSPQICYNEDKIGWSGGTEAAPTYSWKAPAPRSYTEDVKKEIASKKYIDVASQALTKVLSAETQIIQNKEAIELRAKKTEVSENYYNKQQTDTKFKIESDKISSAVERIGTNEKAISTLEQTADGLTVRLDTTDGNVTKAQNTANSVKTDLATNYTKKTLPDTRNDNQPPSWYMTNYPRQVVTEFKYASKIGLSGETYSVLETMVPWTDKSGGYPKQTAKVGDKEYWRIGTSETDWGDWQDAIKKATDAAKTATNFLRFSSSGLVVGDMTAGTLGKNVLIDSDSVDIRTGSTLLASFGANQVILGQNTANSEIDLCDGAGIIKARTSGASTTYPKYDSIRIESQEIELGCKTYDARTSYKDSGGYLYESSHRGLSSAGGYGGVSATTTAPVNSSGIIYINDAGMSSSADKAINQTRAWLFAKQDKTVGNTTSNVKANTFNVYADYSETAKPIKIGSSKISFTGKNKTLWSGAWYMQEGQTATLSEGILSQVNGVALVFSLYSDGETNQEFFTHFIPKSFCDLHNGKGLVATLHSPWGNSTKYLYVSNTTIAGHANNNLTDKTVGGITYNNRRFVMRYVIGV